MLSTIATVLVQLLTTIAPTVTSSSTVEAIISALVNLIPALVGELTALITPVKNIIAALQAGSAPLTSAQIATLTTLDAQCDAALDAAAQADGLTGVDDNVSTAGSTGATGS